MRSTIEIVAERRGSATVVSTIRGGGHFAGRLTAHGSTCEVHLIGTAAGPLGGDEATVVVRVGPGADLALRSAAATIIQPGLHQPDSVLRIHAHVADGAHLDLRLEPTVVCAGAVHHAELLVTLEGDGQAVIAEEVVLGRSGEAPGEWSGRTWLTRDERAILRHLIRSPVLGPQVRAIATRLRSRPGDDAVLGSAVQGSAVHGSAVRMPLAAGGRLDAAIGSSLVTARADLAELAVAPVAVAPVTVARGASGVRRP